MSEYEANGLVVARGSHHLHQEMLSNGSWRNYSGSNSGQLRLLQFYRQVGETFPLLRTRLEPGDVVLFSKCSVHTTSGINSLARQRYAWQIRFVADTGDSWRHLESSLYPVMGSSLSDRGYSQPQVWPHTECLEDSWHRSDLLCRPPGRNSSQQDHSYRRSTECPARVSPATQLSRYSRIQHT